MAVTVRLEGIEKAMRDINKYLVDYKGNTDKVFFEFYAKVRQDAMTVTPTVPKDTGNLRNSMFFTYSKGYKDGRGAKQNTDLISKCQAECKIAYTINKPTAIIGFAAEYAAVVHEAVNKRFREPGSGAKYFETHIVSNENYFVELLKKARKMTGIAGIIKDYLVSKGITYTYVNIMPNTPQKCVVIYDVAGRSPEFTFDGAKFRKPSIQITTRDYKYDDSYSLISDVISYLEQLEGTTYNNIQFIAVEQTTDIFSYDYQDEYNNMLKCFAVNFNLEIFKQ